MSEIYMCPAPSLPLLLPAVSPTQYPTREEPAFPVMIHARRASSCNPDAPPGTTLFKSLCVNNGTVIIFHHLGRAGFTKRRALGPLLPQPLIICAGSSSLPYSTSADGWHAAKYVYINK